MPEMHASMKRLYHAASQLSPAIRGQSELARAIGQSPQTVNNWESRGVSSRGATLCQTRLGISSTWILHAEPPLFVVGRDPSTQSHAVERQRRIIAAAVTLVRYVEDMAAEPLSDETRQRLPLAALAELEANWPEGIADADLPLAGRGVIARLRSGGR